MNTFKEFTKRLNEMSLSTNDYSRFDTYIDEISDFKKTLKNFDKEIKLLKELLINIEVSDIRIRKIRKYNNQYILIFKNDVHILCSSIDSYMNSIYTNNIELYEHIENKYFGGSYYDLKFYVDVEHDRFNKFHFPVVLPEFLKNIGLGKKILLSAIDKFEYLYFDFEEDSKELKMVVDSLIKRTDVCSFMLDNKIFIFKEDFDLISKELKNIFDGMKPVDYALDIDFKEKYKNEILENEFLSSIYNK